MKVMALRLCKCVRVLALLTSALSAFEISAREKVVFDTDIGGDVDDALALAYLLKCPTCDLIGVTIEAWGGNGPRQAEIASAICLDYGRKDVRIAVGSGAGNLIGARFGKHPNWKPRYWPVVKNRAHDEFTPRNDAVDYLREVIRANPGEITIVATGHYTNLGALFTVDPDLPASLKRLVIMGGRPFSGGSEWNVCIDPVATGIVFANGNTQHPPETLVVGGNATFPYHYAADEARAFLAGIPSLALCAEAADYWLNEGKELYFHDPIAAVVAMHADFATWTNATVSVSLDEKTGGFVRIDEKPNPRHGALKIATKVDFLRFREMFLRTMKDP